MNTQKVALTMPKELVAIIDDISKKQGVSRSRFISSILYEKIVAEKKKMLKDAYDSVFSEEFIQNEQLDTTTWFERSGNKEGQEW
ncbi:MAG: ribbon-helix-helix domain-containing protein [Proteobacteria bacterium]|nr:ribbon-helix-helix domain-containing protein [Pseudomonadota bacterium]